MKEPRVLAHSLGAPEGPVVLGDGSIALTEKTGQVIGRYAEGSYATVASTGGAPNGAAVDADGTIWVANNGGVELGSKGYWFADDLGEGRIQRVTLDGRCSNLDDLPGELPHRPNDLCFGPDGKLYFTDPRNWEDFANLKMGRIWRLDPSTLKAEVLAEMPLFCNGIAFGPDPSRLFVAQTIARKVLAFPWTPGGLGSPREFLALERGFPDGICFSADGDCYVAGATAQVVQVVDADGKLKETIELPGGSDPTNCCLANGVLYVTCSGSGELVAFDVGVDALPLFPFRSA